MPPDIIQTQKEEIRGALARGYCTKENENKVLYPALIEAMAVEVEKHIANIGRELEARCEEDFALFNGYELSHDQSGAECAQMGAELFKDRTLTLIRSITGISPTR